MRAAIYRRVSDPKQTAGGSLEQQRDACERHAEARGWRIVADYADEGRSAYRDDLGRRPAFQRMLADARGRLFDVVLVYELSRFARRQRVQFSAAGDLESLGIRVVSVTEPMDLDTIGGFVTYSVLAMQAELHSRILSRKMRDTRAAERAHGQPTTAPARGYRWEDGRLVPDGDILPARAYDLAVAGHGTTAVLATLRSEGHDITLGGLHHLLSNPVYAGLLRHDGGLTPGNWPALVGRDAWEHVQALRAARRPDLAIRATVRSGDRSALAGLTFCANCGSKLHYQHNSHGHHYYACKCRNDGGHCDARPSRADRLEAQIDELIASLELTPLIIARARAILHAEQRQSPTPRPDPAERLRRLARAYADGAYSDAEYAARRAELLREPETATVVTVDIDAAVTMMHSLTALWAVATVPERRTLLGHILSRIYARRSEVYAVRPTTLAEPLLRAALDNPGLTSNASPYFRRSIILLDAA